MGTPAPVRSDLPDVLAPVRGDLEAVGAAYARILDTPSEYVSEMAAHSGRFTGKRLRPALACIASRIVRGDVPADVAMVAAIVELIHTATLVHDDVIDGGDAERDLGRAHRRASRRRDLQPRLPRRGAARRPVRERLSLRGRGGGARGRDPPGPGAPPRRPRRADVPRDHPRQDGGALRGRA